MSRGNGEQVHTPTFITSSLLLPIVDQRYEVIPMSLSLNSSISNCEYLHIPMPPTLKSFSCKINLHYIHLFHLSSSVFTTRCLYLNKCGDIKTEANIFNKVIGCRTFDCLVFNFMCQHYLVHKHLL